MRESVRLAEEKDTTTPMILDDTPPLVIHQATPDTVYQKIPVRYLQPAYDALNLICKGIDIDQKDPPTPMPDDKFTQLMWLQSNILAGTPPQHGDEIQNKIKYYQETMKRRFGCETYNSSPLYKQVLAAFHEGMKLLFDDESITPDDVVKHDTIFPFLSEQRESRMVQCALLSYIGRRLLKTSISIKAKMEIV
jgi:hypothetical protein